MRLVLALSVTLGMVVGAWAVDQPISAIKVVIKVADSGKEKFVFVSKDPAFLFPPIGSDDDPANGIPGGAIVDILTRDGGDATFTVPPGESLPPGWKVNDATIDLYKYINKEAPLGPVPLKVVVMKDTKVLKIVGKESGIPLTGTNGDVVIRITTGGMRSCARFDAATIKKDEPGQFIALGAVATSLTDCSMGPPTTVTTSTTSTSSSTTSSSTSSTSTTTSTSTSTSSTSTTSTSTTTFGTTSTSTSLPRIFRFTTGTPTGNCGVVRTGGAGGTLLKTLGCGGLNVGGGTSTVAEGPTPANAETQMTATCAGATCTVTARTSVQTGSTKNCSAIGCAFGPYLPISNLGTSTCVRNTFASPATGTLNSTTGTFTGGFPLTSTVYLTANAGLPCPLCVGGTPGVTNSGTCHTALQWISGDGPSPDAGALCTPVNAAGDSHDCDPPVSVILPAFPVNLTPITTGTASSAGPIFCPLQAAPGGAFSCNGTATALCPGGAAGVANYIAETGVPGGSLTPGTHAATLASTFCIPSVGPPLGFLINASANLPGPGATSLPGTFELVP